MFCFCFIELLLFINNKFTRSRNTYYNRFVGHTSNRMKEVSSDNCSKMKWTNLAFAKWTMLMLLPASYYAVVWMQMAYLWIEPTLIPYCVQMMSTQLVLLTSPGRFFGRLNRLNLIMVNHLFSIVTEGNDKIC